MGDAVPRLGSLESVVMEVLWASREPTSVREVVHSLSYRSPAYTTISTVLENLRRKGWVDRERTGRLWYYRALRDRAAHAADRMHGALADSGNHHAALLRFVDHMKPEDVDVLRTLLSGVPRDGDA